MAGALGAWQASPSHGKALRHSQSGFIDQQQRLEIAVRRSSKSDLRHFVMVCRVRVDRELEESCDREGEAPTPTSRRLAYGKLEINS